MRRLGSMVLPLFGFVLLSGCGSPYRQSYGPEVGGFGDAGGSSAKKGTEELASDGWGTLVGQITFDGDLPGNEKANVSKDKEVCECDEARKRGEDLQLVWVGKKTSAGTGVGNVVIFLKPPQGKHFKIHDKYKDVSGDKVLGKQTLDQPFCAYEPRVVVLYPGYADGKGILSSGQVFEVKNSAPIGHNTKIKGNPQFNAEKSETISAGSKTTMSLQPQDTPLNISCDVHPWMTGYAWAFSHPYSARTDEEGKFKIENVPAGSELSLVIWHEGIGFYNANGFEGKQGKKMTFAKDKSETLNLKLSK